MKLNYLQKIRIIILSRNKKPQNEKWIEERREVCKHCNYNTINMKSIPLTKRLLKYLSDLYSFMWGTLDKDNLGNCSACDSCSIFYKTEEDTEECKHPIENQWKSIYIPNKK